jgi:hypothetical protein
VSKGQIWFLTEIRCEGIDWIHLAPERNQQRELVNMIISYRIPKEAGSFLRSLSQGLIPLSRNSIQARDTVQHCNMLGRSVRG